MFESLMAELLVGIIAAVAGALIAAGIRIYRRWSQKHVEQVTTFVITKLRFKDAGHKPYYQRVNRSTPNAEPDDVYDESVAFGMQVANYKHLMTPIASSTSGHADTYELFPEARQPIDVHPHLKHNTKLYNIQADRPTFALASQSTRWNGTQTTENWWYGSMSRYPGARVTLVLDFSHIPNASNIVFNFTAFTKPPGSAAQQPVAVSKIADDIYSATVDDAAEGQLLQIDFKINQQAVTDTGVTA